MLSKFAGPSALFEKLENRGRLRLRTITAHGKTGCLFILRVMTMLRQQRLLLPQVLLDQIFFPRQRPHPGSASPLA